MIPNVNQRPIRPQKFINLALTVGTVPTPINQVAQGVNTLLYDALIVDNYSTSARSVFWGNAGVTATNGLEIRAGFPQFFVINNERPLYEIQDPLTGMACVGPQAIPFGVWDLSTVYLIAAANTAIAVILFQALFL